MSSQIHVMNASYASPNKGVNVTSECIALVNNGTTEITVLPGDLNISDPDFGVRKGFTITYNNGTETKIKGGIDGDKITLD